MLPNLTALSLTPHPGREADTGPKADAKKKTLHGKKPYDKPEDFVNNFDTLKQEVKEWLRKWAKRERPPGGDEKDGGFNPAHPKLQWWQKADGGQLSVPEIKRRKQMAEEAIEEEKRQASKGIKVKAVQAYQAAKEAFLQKAYQEAYDAFVKKFPKQDLDGQMYPEIEWAEARVILVSTYGTNWAAVEPTLKESRIASAKMEARRLKKLKMIKPHATIEDAAKAAGEAARTHPETIKAAENAAEDARAEYILEQNDAGIAEPSVKQKFRGLLRFFFNRTNPNLTQVENKYKKWHHVDKELRDKRVAWAKKQVMDPNFDPVNPKLPPPELYTADDVTVLNTWSVTTAAFALFDEEHDPSELGGKKMWKYMRWLEKEWPSSSTIKPRISNLSPLQPKGEAFLNSSVRSNQLKEFKDNFSEYMLSIQELSAIGSSAYQYTKGSGPFNKYLMYNAPGVDVDNIPNYGKAPGGAAGNNYAGTIGPPLIVHQLYKTIQAAPRPSTTMHFIRSVRTPEELPHRRNGVATPLPGSVFPNVTFISTSLASPAAYMSGMLAGFFNTTSLCCFMIITTPPGFPVLPLVVGKSAYKEEQEIVLPPGTLLIYRETIHSETAIPGMDTEFVCYDATLSSVESIEKYKTAI